MGMDIRELAKIINTPQGRAITKLCEGDITNGDSGAFSALQAISKLEGNISRDLKQFDVQAEVGEGINGAITVNNRARKTASDAMQSLMEFYYNNVILKYHRDKLSNIPFGKRKRKKDGTPGEIDRSSADLGNMIYQISYLGKMDECLNFIMNDKNPIWTQIMQGANELYNQKEWKCSIYQLAEYCKNYGSLVKTYYSNNAYYAKNLRILAQGAEEMRILGTLLSSNKGLKTKIEEGLEFVKTLENAVIDRKKQLGQNINLAEDKIDFILFCMDNEYRKEAIQKYEQVKHTTNILDVMAHVPHFLSYLRAYAITQATFKMGSIKFRAREDYYDYIIDTLKLTKSIDKENAARGIENAVNYKMLREWTAEEQLQFILPKGNRLFVGRHQEAIDTEDDVVVPLWDENGLATFKLYMDQKVIPELKSNPSYINNTFIQGLTPFEMTKTGTHAAITAYTLEGNMLPFTESQIIQMENYKADFNQMYDFSFPGSKTFGINSIPSLADAFYIYSQYVFNGKKGQRSLISLFDSGECILAKHFEQFEANLDASTSYRFEDDELIAWCAPNSNIYNPSSQVFYAVDKKELGNQLYKQAKETMEEGSTPIDVVRRVDESKVPMENRQNYINPATDDIENGTNVYNQNFNNNVSTGNQKPIILSEDEVLDIVANDEAATFSAISRGPLTDRGQKIVDYINRNIERCTYTTLDPLQAKPIKTIKSNFMQALVTEAINAVDNNC